MLTEQNLQNYEAAFEFLKALDNGSDRLTFQTFDDCKDRKSSNLIRVLHGPFKDHVQALAALNEKGAGIFTTINQTDGTGRKGENITKARALVVDFDNERPERLQDLQTLELIHGIKEPSLVVESSHGKHHAYWLCDDLTPEQYTALQVALFKTLAGFTEFSRDEIDTTLKDKAKVIRVAGFKHQKDPANPFLSKVVHNSGRRYKAAELAEMLQGASLPLQEQQTPTQATGDAITASFEALANNERLNVGTEELSHYLDFIQYGKNYSNSYDEWVKVGMALHHETQGSSEGLALWDAWSKKQPNYNSYTDLADHWKTFTDSKSQPVRAATLRHLAQKHASYSPYLDDWTEPENLAAEEDEPTPYPINAWRGVLRDAIKATAYHAQVTEALAGYCVLGALAHMGQPFINAPMGRGHTPTSLFLVAEGETGLGKTQAMGITHAVIEQQEEEAHHNYIAARDLWLLEYNSRTPKEQKQFEATNPKPVERITIFSDTTIEPVLDMFIDGQLVNGSWSTDEAGQFFGGHTMKGDTSLNALGALTTLWSKGGVSRIRSKRNRHASDNSRAFNVRLTMLLLGQRVVLEKALNDPEMNGQGFLARTLIAAPEDLRGQRVWNDPERNSKDPKDDPRIAEYWKRCEDLLKANTAESEPNDRYNMPYADKATANYFFDQMQAIEERMARGQQFEYLKGYASRMAENASRIAALIAFFDKRGAVTISDLKSGFALVEYSTAERLRYMNVNDTSQQSDAERLCSWLVSKVGNKQPPKINKSIVYNGAPKPMRKDSRKLDEVLKVLESAGHIKEEIEGTRRKVIYINPYLIK